MIDKKEYMKHWVKNNPEKHKANIKRWQEKNPNYNKERYLKNKNYIISQEKIYRSKNRGKILIRMRNYACKRNYGITWEQKNQMRISQNNKCAICESDFLPLDVAKGKGICVDHNHSTNQIRQLLCHRCNMVLGVVKEDRKLLQSYIKYLDKWNAEVLK